MRTFFPLILIVLFTISCKTITDQQKTETANQFRNKIESSEYSFTPQTALPMGGQSISLNYSYSLKVSKDTINAYLPYYGRAYTAPSPSEEGGIKFISTDFKYNLSKEKNGSWDATIDIADNQKRYKLILKLSDSGYATLNVQDNNRQPISFYGKIE